MNILSVKFLIKCKVDERALDIGTLNVPSHNQHLDYCKILKFSIVVNNKIYLVFFTKHFSN